jgi:glycosyltransferase involved in cell wall biosynthesis
MSTAVARDLETLGIDTPQHRVEHPVYDVFGERLPHSEARSRLGLPQEAPVVLFFGFIRRYKGLMDLLHSLPKVLTVRPDVRLVVAGECYEDDAAYRAYVRDHGLEEVVQWHLTYIPTEDVAVYFCAADVVVQPNRTATQSGVAQIAYHFERPLIVTDVGGLAEIVPHEKAGLVVPPCNPDALAQAIVRFFAEDLGARFQEGLREVKARYSWDRLFEALEEWL